MTEKKNQPFLELTRIEVSSHQEQLTEIQGNILKKHGGNHEALLYLNFSVDTISIKKLLSELEITSAYQQYLDSEAYKKSGGKELKTFKGLYLSHTGIDKLGCSGIPTSQVFMESMKGRKTELNDPDFTDWEYSFQNEIDAILLLADDDLDQINSQVEKLRLEWGTAIEINHIQYGVKRPLVNDQTVEHFGYVDGISQPLFYQSDFKSRTYINDKWQDVKLTENHWSAEAPLSLVLVKEEGTGSYGSFLVYRKLEQNVKRFKESEERLAACLGLTGEAAEIAGAMMVGRFENGLPVVKLGSVTDPENPNEDNDFQYDQDAYGLGCPFHAHIRKSNPRGDSKRFFAISEEEERSHRIARRGITYDEIGRDQKPEHEQGPEYPEGGVGLLFMCFQSSIENQFEFIQRSWVNNNHFPKPFTGIDPVIGQGEPHRDSLGNVAEQKWHSSVGGLEISSLSGFVKMKGGGYFYAPSLTFLRNLK